MNLFETLLGAGQVGGTLILSPVLRSWYNHWGISEDDARRELPGDDLISKYMMGYTRAIVIHGSAQAIWPWLVQLGQGRGGLYSYDSLENLVGCDIHSLDRISPEMQDLEIGDLIRLGPEGYPCFNVMQIEPERALILISADPKTGQTVQPTTQLEKGYSIATWQFVLEPLGEKSTRLYVRQRLAYSPDLAFLWRIVEPVAFVMERKMLLGIRSRVEGILRDPARDG